jgi:acetyl-CoA C-acetyltransferase
MNKAVYIVGAKRTPVGSFMGVLSEVGAVQLGATALRAALEHAKVDPNTVEELFFGCVLQANLGQAPATQVALAAGLPPTVPCTLVNKVCASGTKSIMMAANQIRTGDMHITVAGGMESMSQAPHYITGHRNGYKYGNQELLDAIVRDALQDVYKKIMMGTAAEMAAAKYGFGREAQDQYAINAYHRTEKAQKENKFANEIVGVKVKGKKGEEVIMLDEEPGRVNYEKIPTLKPAFPDKEGKGTVTAANASKLNDGASAVVLASEEAVKKYNLKPLARIVSFGDAAREPDWFTIAPADAIPVALKRGGVSANQIDLWEINEAFSVVAQANAKLLDIDLAKLNIYGGAVSMGHPVGSSGSRIVVTLVNALHNENKKYGGVGICNGGGGAAAMVLEKV